MYKSKISISLWLYNKKKKNFIYNPSIYVFRYMDMWSGAISGNHWDGLITAVTTPEAPINLNFYGANTFH